MYPINSDGFLEKSVALESFHFLLYDSLMPWLPENSDPLRYRLLIDDLTVHEGRFFQGLLDSFRKRNLKIPSLLKKEWDLFNRISFHPRAINIFQSMTIQHMSQAKIYFYYELVFNALLYSESYFLSLMDQATQPLNRYYVNQWLKTIGDLRQRTQKVFQDTNENDNQVILFFTDTALKVLGIEIQQLFAPLCSPAWLIQNLGGLKTDAGAPRKDALPIEDLNDWFENIYLIRFNGPEKQIKTKEPVFLKDEAKDSHWEALRKMWNLKDDGALPVSEKPLSPQENQNTEKSNKEEIIGSEKVRKILGIGKNKLWQMCRNDEIAHFRIGKNYKFNKSEILEFRERLKNKQNRQLC